MSDGPKWDQIDEKCHESIADTIRRMRDHLDEHMNHGYYPQVI